MWLLAIGTNLVYCSNHLWVRKQIPENISPNKSCFCSEIHRNRERLYVWRVEEQHLQCALFNFVCYCYTNKIRVKIIWFFGCHCGVVYTECVEVIWAAYASQPEWIIFIFCSARSFSLCMYLSMFDTNKVTLRGTENNFGLAMWTQTHAVAKQLFALILVNLIQWQRLCMRNILHAQWLYLWVWRWIRNATRGSSTENTQFSVRDLLTFH